MKCYYHETAGAVAACQYCGKFLCKTCAGTYTPCLCEECFKIQCDAVEKGLKQKKTSALIDTHVEFFKAIIIGLVTSFVLTSFFGAMGSRENIHIVESIMFFFVPFGWMLLTHLERWFPYTIMSLPIFGAYIFIKFCFSVILGFPYFMFIVIKYFFRLIRINFFHS